MSKVIRFKHKGDFSKTLNFFKRVDERTYMPLLRKYGRIGVDALASATPKDTGKTAMSWKYRIEQEGHRVSIQWYNTNENKGVNIAVILEYGHGTRQGGYVKGRQYIKPTIRPVFDALAEEAWGEVTRD